MAVSWGVGAGWKVVEPRVRGSEGGVLALPFRIGSPLRLLLLFRFAGLTLPLFFFSLSLSLSFSTFALSLLGFSNLLDDNDTVAEVAADVVFFFIAPFFFIVLSVLAVLIV